VNALSDPATAVRVTNLVVDCNDLALVVAFWGQLLSHSVRSNEADWVDLEPLAPAGPVLSFQRVPEGKAGKNRIHLDLVVPDAVAAGRRVTELGGTPASSLHEGSQGSQRPWQVWHDPEGNEFCLITG
jgi:hypothetical protein